MRWERIWYDMNTKKPLKQSRKLGDGLKSMKIALETVAVDLENMARGCT